MKEYLFIDFDDTLFSHRTKQIPDLATKALNALDKEKYQLVLCTGRCRFELDYYFDLPSIPYDYYIYLNGSLITDAKHQIIYDSPVSESAKEGIIKAFKERLYPISIATGDNNFINFVNDDVRKVFRSEKHFIKEKAYENEKFYLASIFLNQEIDNGLKERYFSQCLLTKFNDFAYDIVSGINSKDRAISILLEHLNVDFDHTYAFGDSENDLGMLKCCRHSIAMGNAIAQAKEVAEYVTADIDDDGIFKALQHYKLIENTPKKNQ